MLKQILASCSLVAVLGMGALPVLAQRSAPLIAQATSKAIADEELQKFVTIAKKLSEISNKRSELIGEAITQEKLTVERFREIYTVKKDPKVKPKTAISSEEQQKFDRVLAKLVDIQKQTQTDMGKAVAAENLEMPRFLEILEAVQKTPELRSKVEKLMK